MALSNDLISQFVKATSDKKKDKTDTKKGMRSRKIKLTAYLFYDIDSLYTERYNNRVRGPKNGK